MRHLTRWFNMIIKKRRELRRWQRIVTVLAAIITFATTYALILPAITIEREHTDEVAGMYLEQSADADAMLEENAPEPTEIDASDVQEGEETAPSNSDAADGEEITAAPEVRTLRSVGSDYTVTLTYDETSGIPSDADLYVSEIAQDSEEYETYLEEAKKAMGLAEEEALPRFAARFFDIKIMVGDQEFVPESGVSVEITYAEPMAENPETEVSAVHFADEAAEAEVIEASTTNVQDDGAATVEFTAESFSVYGVIYTVDFHWEVNGKTYEFSFPGGSFVSFEHLVEVLGIRVNETGSDPEDINEPETIADDTEAENAVSAQKSSYTYDEAINLNNAEVREATRKFVREVENIEFSDPELVWIGKADEAVTVGDLKETNRLKVEYSSNLTEAQISEINANRVEAGDWALISMKPFTSEETMTVTMKNGDQFEVKVTDAQISTWYISDKGELYEVTVTYGADAQIPEGSKLKVTEFEEGSSEYISVRNAVIADKQARGEVLDFTDLAALDISIINPAGNEIEPAAPVSVQLNIKKLPGVENLGMIAGTLKVKHHVETEEGVVVETVYSGGTAAEFVMETDETVAAAGTAVDPQTAELNAIGFSSLDLNADGSVVTNAIESQDEIDVTFETALFSSFTVQWSSSGSIDPSVSINWGNGGWGLSYIPYAQVNIHYVNQDGTEINKPSSVNDIDLSDLATASHSYNIENVFGKSMTGFTYQGAHFGSYTGESVTDLTLSGFMGPWYIWDGNVMFYNGSTEVARLTANGDPFAVNTPTADIYLVYNGESNVPHATVHYVDEDGVELTVSNGTPVSDTAYYTYNRRSYNDNYLIYDIDGYEYDYTYRNSKDNLITPVLRYDNNRWKYTTGTSVGAGFSNLTDGDEIYVVYKKRAEPPSGGSPQPDPQSEHPDPATITKLSKDNKDGTNTLSLSVTGHTKVLETKKMADVIVIYDVSGSMDYVMNAEREARWNERSRMDEAEDATKELAHTLLTEKNTAENPDLIRMALISFSNTAQVVQGFTNDEGTFTDAIDNDLPNPGGGTNWEYALQLANEMSVASDRATYVIFVTDGNPTFRLARQVLNNSGTNGLVANDVTPYYYQYHVYGHGDSDDWGRNYAGALAQVKAIVNSNKHFYTIGIGPTASVSNLTNLLDDANVPANHGHTATDSTQLANAFSDIASKILGTLGHSSISISDGITELTQIVKKTSLVDNEAFDEDDFTYWKGKVDHLATQEDVDNKLAANVDDPVVLESAWAEWNPSDENCEKAKYEDGAVVWNMGDTFMPEEGYTYQVRFKVWPSQEAYDLLAGLNNELYFKDDTEKVIKNSDGEVIYGTEYYNQISGEYPSYQLKTNDETSYSYKEATLVDGIVTPLPDTGGSGSFDDVDPLRLTTSPLKVQKQFEYNYVDSKKPEDSVTLELYSMTDEGEWEKTFKTITLDAVYQTDDDGNYVDAEGRILHEADGKYCDAEGIERERVLVEAESWYSEKNFVSYGLVTYDEDDPNGTSKVYETGHDFTLRESGINAHYYELEAQTYRPMYINGRATVLEQTAKPADMNENVFHYLDPDTSKNYYKLDGKYYVDTGSDVIMSALNKHRSYMDLTKRVENDSADAAAAPEEFEYRITFTVPRNIYNYEDVEQYIWFSIYNPSDRRTLAPSEFEYSGAMAADEWRDVLDSDEYSGSEYDNYLIATSEQTFTLKIKENWNVRFLNLPIGTTYEFEEVNIPAKYSFVSAAVSGTVWPKGSATGPAAAIDSSELPTNDGSSAGDTSIEGTIEFANARYRTTYTNKTLTQKIDIMKTRQNATTPLEGAEFILYTKDGYEADPKISSRSGLVSGADGIIELGELAVGEYRLVETKAPRGFILLTEPIEITVNADRTVTYSQPGHATGASGSGVSGDVENGYQLVIINDEGAALPNTGGRGTTVLYILGMILTGIAGAALIIKRRVRAA